MVAHLLDATNAFVGSRIDKEIFMEIPQGLYDHEFSMNYSKDRILPLGPSTNLSADSQRLSKDLHSKFQRIIGQLTYLAGGTRPDI
ncbi:hypothetical protein TSTA_007850 [Talaromyces stipitatus ATCC 10500]|uniref:Uncharacterized protein n=1 Tax=Talaromyces stipitatus (strain ATCC 10500 / CBS 375.48 / QM 6759 / NRRL 1006) TaxID=441959 RepID=B8MVD5_TALSN|nr:uncharacterized protein TSTA_007850 [Talaromyces stipitatus ATCC 10500]EED11495.1 hypothetical protein TSTA_007850 [Talaromyces stipitatus ATCC 10500]